MFMLSKYFIKQFCVFYCGECVSQKKSTTILTKLTIIKIITSGEGSGL